MHTEKEMRKHQKATVQAAIERREAMINAIIIGAILLTAIGMASGGIWYVGSVNGKW